MFVDSHNKAFNSQPRKMAQLVGLQTKFRQTMGSNCARTSDVNTGRVLFHFQIRKKVRIKGCLMFGLECTSRGTFIVVVMYLSVSRLAGHGRNEVSFGVDTRDTDKLGLCSRIRVTVTPPLTLSLLSVSCDPL